MAAEKASPAPPGGPNATFQIFVKHMATFETLTLVVTAEDTILSIKQQIEKRSGISVAEQLITKSFKCVCANAKTLGFYNVGKGDTLQVFVITRRS